MNKAYEAALFTINRMRLTEERNTIMEILVEE